MITCVFGDVGTGKTFLMTYFGYMANKQGIPVYANYKLTFVHKRIDSIQDLHIHEEKKNMVLLDEAWLTADSRRSHANIEISKLILQSRKMKSDLMYSAQKPTQIDVRIRGITHLFVHPTISLCDDEGVPIIITAESFIKNPMSTDSLTHYNTVDYFVYGIQKYYDTNEIIEPTVSYRHKDLLKKFVGFEGSRMKLEAILHLDEGLSKSDAHAVASYIL